MQDSKHYAGGTQRRTGPKTNPISYHVLVNAFQAFDKNSNGYLDADELRAALTSIGSKLGVDDLDKDGDRKVSLDEFCMLANVVGRHTHPIYKKKLEQLAMGDEEPLPNDAVAGKAHMNDTFMKSAAKAWRQLSVMRDFDEVSLLRAFRRIDVNGDGYLQLGEVRRAIKEVAPHISEVDITLMMATADVDGSGNLTFEEWKKLMTYDHASDVPYYQAYGKRDMHVLLADRT